MGKKHPTRSLRGRAEKRAPNKLESWRSALSRLEGAYAANTIRAYSADFRIFEAWCRKTRHTALPASADTVAEFIQAQSESAAPATVDRRRASISKIHRLLKLESPTRSEEVNLATRTMFRQKGRLQKQALGLTAPLKAKLTAACPGDLRGLRDRAVIAMGYDTLCRRSELVALRIEDLRAKADGSGTILVRKAKADQFGTGRLAYVSAETMDRIAAWLAAADLKSGLIFRAVVEEEISGHGLRPQAVSEVLKTRARRAGLADAVLGTISGHSMRVGAAQDMAAAGIDLGAIMHAGGWKTPAMVMRYIEHMDVEKSGMARLYGGITRANGFPEL